MELQNQKKTSKTVKLGKSTNSIPLTDSELQSLMQWKQKVSEKMRIEFQNQINSPNSQN
jgi:ABC-type bacteriocin/lantibiotic exporter with double-glycine peptidase domain